MFTNKIYVAMNFLINYFFQWEDVDRKYIKNIFYHAYQIFSLGKNKSSLRFLINKKDNWLFTKTTSFQNILVSQ